MKSFITSMTPTSVFVYDEAVFFNFVSGAHEDADAAKYLFLYCYLLRA